MMTSIRRKFSRLRLLRLLDDLQSAPGPATSLYIPPAVPISEIERSLAIAVENEDIQADIARVISRSITGAALFWGSTVRCLVLPPFPINERSFLSGYDIEPLHALLQREFIIALILLRLGAYAIGVFKGQELLSSKVGTGHIHSRHKKGGSSQHRFARRREKEIEYFLTRVCGRVQERIEPFVKQIEYVVYGGERHTLLAFRKSCEFLQTFDNKVLASRLNVREPKQATLETAIAEVWSSEVVQWYDDDTTDRASQ